MAAGTAAALVPIRSITRRLAASDPQSLSSSVKQHARLSFKDGEETVTYVADGDEEPGPLCIKLLSQLKGIQNGKVEDKFGWNFKVSAEDGKKAAGAPANGNGNGQNGEPNVDQLD